MSWSGILTELEPGFSLTDWNYDLRDVFVEQNRINFAWTEDEGTFEVSLRKTKLHGVEIWLGEMVRYELADGGLLLVGNWVFGEVSGVYFAELFSESL